LTEKRLALPRKGDVGMQQSNLQPIAQAFRFLRECQHLSQRAVSSFQYTASNLSRFEHGIRSPYVSTLVDLCANMNVTNTELGIYADYFNERSKVMTQSQKFTNSELLEYKWYTQYFRGYIEAHVGELSDEVLQSVLEKLHRYSDKPDWQNMFATGVVVVAEFNRRNNAHTLAETEFLIKNFSVDTQTLATFGKLVDLAKSARARVHFQARILNDYAAIQGYRPEWN
jgi:transcriptional regulator with XRE-family HTH domain